MEKFDSNGNKFIYTVEQTNLPKKYTQKQEGFNFTNTFSTDEQITIDGQIIWDDYQNKLGYRPEKQRLILKQNDEMVTEKDVPITEDSNDYLFDKLEKFDSNGNKFIYTVEQTNLPKKYTQKQEGFNFTNTFSTDEQITIDGQIIWDDYQNKLGYRPEKQRLILKQNDEMVTEKDVPITEDSNDYLFDKLEKFDSNGNKFIYTVEQTNLPKEYTEKQEGFNFTNTFSTDEQIAIDGQIIWDDYQNKFETRPEKQRLLLKQNDEVVAEKDVSIIEDSNDYLFDKLEKFDSNGNEYFYTVEQTNLPKKYTEKQEGFNFTNTFSTDEQITIEGQIIWDDYQNKFDTRPESIQIQLYQNMHIVDTIDIIVSEKEIDYFTFENLNKYDDNGLEIIYETEQKAIDNYQSKSNKNIITNSYRSNEKEIIKTAIKWNDFEDKLKMRPEKVTISVYQNEILLNQTELTQNNDYNYTFSTLEKYDKDGSEYNYRIEQEDIKKYHTEKYEDNNQEKNIVFNNNFLNQETTSISGEIIWMNDSNQINERPEKVYLSLYQESFSNIISLKETIEVTPDEDGNWLYGFNHLQKYDMFLDTYNYSVIQHDINDYETYYNGTNIINTLKQKNDISSINKNTSTEKISSQNKYKLFPATGEKRKNKLFYIGMIIIIFTITSYNLRKNKK